MVIRTFKWFKHVEIRNLKTKSQVENTALFSHSLN